MKFHYLKEIEKCVSAYSNFIYTVSTDKVIHSYVSYDSKNKVVEFGFNDGSTLHKSAYNTIETYGVFIILQSDKWFKKSSKDGSVPTLSSMEQRFNRYLGDKKPIDYSMFEV